jgi:ABC-type transport system involved in multi-copper enzyme maturation permease subunit
MLFRGALSVFRFEWSRTLTLARLIGWLVLALFPPTILSLLKMQGVPLEEHVVGFVLYVLIPEVVCLLGLLLWATPLVQAEMEGKTWIYVAVRPNGRNAVLLGKYLTAVTWTTTAAWTAAALSVLLAFPAQPVRILIVICTLVLLSCLCYGAIYCFFAVLFHRRAMVFAVVYTLLVEVLVSVIPAMINELTVNYRLRNLLVIWMGWWPNLSEDWKLLLSDKPAWRHLLVLAMMPIIFLGASMVVLRLKEYVSADDA